MPAKADVYQIITDRIVTMIEEKRTVPWRMPWRNMDGGNMPKNLISGKDYRGINVFMLHYGSTYASPYWLSYKQAESRGAQVRKGERGTPVVFWNWIEKDDPDTGKRKKIPFLRYYTVFNAEQCNDLDYPKPEAIDLPEKERIERCEKLVADMPHKPEIAEDSARAFYMPATDSVHVPAIRYFDSQEAFYCTLFHELGHSTGHEKRLNRKGITEHNFFGSHDYGQEELIAEFCASYLCAVTGTEQPTIDNSAAYLQSWLSAIRGNPKMLVQAAAQAQKAADYILGKAPASEEEQAE